MSLLNQGFPQPLVAPVALAVAQASARPVTGTLGAAAPDTYAANGFEPAFAFDPSGSLNSGTPYYRSGGSAVDLDSFSLPEPDGLRTMVDSSGNLVWGAHNLFVSSESPSTQDVTVTSGAGYTVQIEGAGSIALTGAGSGTVTDGSPVTITASTTTLTCTVSGSPTRAWVKRSDLGGMVDVPSSYRTSGAPADYLATSGTARYLPRVGHHIYDGSEWVDEGVLVEREARTQLYPSPLALEDASWEIANTNSLTVTDGESTGPDGQASLARVEITDTTNEDKGLRNDANVTTTVDTDYCLAWLIRPDSQRYVGIRAAWGATDWAVAVFDLDTGTRTDTQSGAGTTSLSRSGIVDAGNGLYLIYLVAQDSADTTLKGGITFHSSGTPTLDANSGVEAYAGTAGAGIWAGSPQLEAGNLPSSFIPDANTVRTADPALTFDAADLPWNASGVSIAVIGTVTYADESSGENPLFFNWRANNVNYIKAENVTIGSRTGEVIWEQRESISGLDRSSAPVNFLSPGVNQPLLIASRHTDGAIQGAGAGTAFTANTTPTALADLSAEDLDIPSTNWMGTISRVVIWADDIAEAGIEQASTEDNVAP